MLVRLTPAYVAAVKRARATNTTTTTTGKAG